MIYIVSCCRCQATTPIEAHLPGEFKRIVAELGWKLETFHLPSGELVARDWCPQCAAEERT